MNKLTLFTILFLSLACQNLICGQDDQSKVLIDTVASQITDESIESVDQEEGIIRTSEGAQIDSTIIVQSPTPEVTINDDSRIFDDHKIQEYRNLRKFNFTQNPKYESNILRRLFYRFLDWLSNSEVNLQPASLVARVVYFVFLALVGFWIIRTLLKYNYGGFFLKKEDKIELEDIDENIDEASLDDLLDQAKANQEYSKAIRILYLKSLRKLDDGNFILWKSGKTNIDYIYEIKSEDVADSFRDLTRNYEYVWYGDFELESFSEYELIESQFYSFFAKLQNNPI